MIQKADAKKKKRKNQVKIKVVSQTELMALFFFLLVQLGIDGNPNEASFSEEIFEHFPKGASISATKRDGRIYFYAIVPGEKKKELSILLPDNRLIIPTN